MINPYLHQTEEWSNFFLQVNRNDTRHQIHKFVSNSFEVILYQYPLFKNQMFWYIPRGFVVKNNINEESGDYIEEIKLLLKKIEDKAKSQGNVVHIKIDFNCLPIFEGVATYLGKIGYKYSNRKIQYNKTMYLNLNNDFVLAKADDDEEKFDLQTIVQFWDANQTIFNKLMDKRTRYGIRKALQFPWKINIEKNDKQLSDFLKIHIETAKRQKFFTYPSDYFDTLMKLDSSIIYNLYDQDDICHASWLGINKHKTIYHLFGANDNVSRDNYGQYLLHLIAIYQAVESGASIYDLGGLEENKGYNLFKKGFNGEIINFYGPYDKVIKPFWYNAYNFYRFIKSMK